MTLFLWLKRWNVETCVETELTETMSPGAVP
jgi:hypothetical protein